MKNSVIHRYFILIFTIYFGYSFGQKSVEDSIHLEKILKTTTKFINRNIKDSIHFNDVLELERIYTDITDVKRKAVASLHLGIYHRSIFSLDEAERYFIKGKELAMQVEDWDLTLEFNKELIVIYRSKNQLDELKATIDSSLATVKAHGLESKILIPLMELTLFYTYDTDQYEKGIIAGERFLKEAEYYNNKDTTDDFMFAYRYETETVVLKLELAKCYIHLSKNLKLAKAYLEEAANFFEPFDDNEKLFRIYEQFINYYSKVGNLKKVRESLTKFNHHRKKNDFNFLNRTNEIPKYISKSATLERDLKLTKLENEKLAFERSVFLGFLLLMLVSSLISYISFLKNKRIQKKLNNSLVVQNQLLETVNKEKSKFFSILSHELRTPIYAITGLTSIMADQQVDQQQIKAIKHSGNYLLFLINNILKFTNFEQPNKVTQSKSSPFNLTEVLQGVVQSSGYFASQHKIKIKLETPWESEYWVKGDPQKLTQVLLNLIVNSIKYSQDEKVVLSVQKLSETKHSENIRFKVADNGVGISKEKQRKMFQFMEKGVKESKNENPFNLHGMGIGLFVVDKLVKEMGTKIEVESEINKGTVFSFAIDFEKAAAVPATKTINQISASVTGNILVVDDNRINLMVAKKMIEKLDFKCFTATDTDDVISLILEKNIQLIFMDLNMPFINGYDLSKKIKETINVPIVAHTAVIEEELDIKLLKASGISNYIIKPYTEETLKRTIINGLITKNVNKS